MAAPDFPSTEIAQFGTVRLVASGRLKPPVLEPLADDEDDLNSLVQLEYVTHGRLTAGRRGLPDLDPGELVSGVPNATFVNAAFCYPRPGGNRFNDERRGAWYAAFARKTAIAEVQFHLTRFLEETGSFRNVTDYAELLADFIGRFHDLWRLDPPTECLHEDVSIGYPAGQELASRLRAEGSKGIVYPSVRDEGGTCLVAFHPSSVQNVVQGELWRFEWSGERDPVVSRVAEQF